MGCCGENSKEKDEPLWNVKMERNCTDLTCLLLFIVYIGGMGVLTAYGLYRGGAERLLYGMYNSVSLITKGENLYDF